MSKAASHSVTASAQRSSIARWPADRFPPCGLHDGGDHCGPQAGSIARLPRFGGAAFAPHLQAAPRQQRLPRCRPAPSLPSIAARSCCPAAGSGFHSLPPSAVVLRRTLGRRGTDVRNLMVSSSRWPHCRTRSRRRSASRRAIRASEEPAVAPADAQRGQVSERHSGAGRSQQRRAAPRRTALATPRSQIANSSAAEKGCIRRRFSEGRLSRFGHFVIALPAFVFQLDASGWRRRWRWRRGRAAPDTPTPSSDRPCRRWPAGRPRCTSR